MPSDLIRKKTRNELQGHFVGTTLREIETEFGAADVPFDEDYDLNHQQVDRADLLLSNITMR